MDQVIVESATIGVVISLISYEIGIFMKNKLKLAIFNPLLVSIVLVSFFFRYSMWIMTVIIPAPSIWRIF